MALCIPGSTYTGAHSPAECSARHAEEKLYLQAIAVAAKIADKANECCYRSDGYEEAIAQFALDEIWRLLRG